MSVGSSEEFSSPGEPGKFSVWFEVELLKDPELQRIVNI